MRLRGRLWCLAQEGKNQIPGGLSEMDCKESRERGLWGCKWEQR